jgi:16S rRNA (guanine966-N2)-methyltransferase
MARGQIRIIGGEWRGRKLSVPDVPNLRPTPDRVRETLFNWLAPYIHGAYCLDPFAGSGALGFEALSRGAAQVVMVDQSPTVIKLLEEEKALLKAENLQVYQGSAPAQLKTSERPFDIVFLDPPFQENLLIPTCQYLAQHAFLAQEAFVYLEAKENLNENDFPQGWSIIKSKRAGQVAYHLVRVSHSL